MSDEIAALDKPHLICHLFKVFPALRGDYRRALARLCQLRGGFRIVL
jgi:hypothetical protein